MAKMSPVHSSDSCNGNIQPIDKARMLAGDDNVRRKLSTIFQTPPSGMVD